MAVFQTHFVEEKAQRANADHTAFHPETYPAIGKKEAEIQTILHGIQQLRKEMAEKGGVADDAIRLEEREKEPYGLKGSTITLQQLKKRIKELPDGTKIAELKSGGWIDCTRLQQFNTALQKEREALDRLVRIHLADACQAIAEAGESMWWITGSYTHLKLPTHRDG